MDESYQTPKGKVYAYPEIPLAAVAQGYLGEGDDRLTLPMNWWIVSVLSEFERAGVTISRNNLRVMFAKVYGSDKSFRVVMHRLIKAHVLVEKATNVYLDRDALRAGYKSPAIKFMSALFDKSKAEISNLSGLLDARDKKNIGGVELYLPKAVAEWAVSQSIFNSTKTWNETNPNKVTNKASALLSAFARKNGLRANISQLYVSLVFVHVWTVKKGGDVGGGYIANALSASIKATDEGKTDGSIRMLRDEESLAEALSDFDEWVQVKSLCSPTTTMPVGVAPLIQVAVADDDEFDLSTLPGF